MDSRLRGNDRFVQAQPLTVRFPSPPEWAMRRSPPDRYDAGTARTVRAPYPRGLGEPPERPAAPTPPRLPAPRYRPSPRRPAPRPVARRLGKACVSTCSTRWSQHRTEKKTYLYLDLHIQYYS